jgi:glycosyltransferase involved in cell wall biosynthesis
VIEKPPVISIIIVTYNAAKTLQACLDSIYAQKYPAIQIVVIDGKSTDGTVDIIHQNAERIGYWVSEKDAGIYDAINKGLKHITGKWVYFFGADDELLDDFSVMASELDNDNAIYYGNVLSNGQVFWGELNLYHIAKYGIYHQAVIYPASVFKKYNYQPQYIMRADHVLNMQCVSDKEFRLIYKNYILAKYNHLGESNTVIDVQFESDHVGLVFKYFPVKIALRIAFWKFKEKNIRKKVTGKDLKR